MKEEAAAEATGSKRQPDEDEANSQAQGFIDLWQRSLLIREHPIEAVSGVGLQELREALGHILEAHPLAGRLIHGRDPSGFDRLSTDTWKRLSWVFGPDAVQSFIGLDGWSMCRDVGMDSDWLRHELAVGTTFKLAIFPIDVQGHCLQATWDNVAVLVKNVYQEVADKVLAQLPAIRALSMPEIEDRAGYDMLDVNLQGRDVDPRYVSVDRLRRKPASECGITVVRQFLMDELGLKRPYTGTGLTEGGLAEFLVPNRPLKEIPGCVVIDLDVRPPQGGY